MVISLNNITKPAWYFNGGKAELGPFDFSIQQELGIAAFNVIKYTTRAGRKPGNTALKDYKQAKFYLERLIAQEEADMLEKQSSREPEYGVASPVRHPLQTVLEPFGMLHEAPRYCTQCQHAVGNSATGRDSGSTICEGAPDCNCPNSIHAAKVR
jgi:hypothetical protein